MEEVIGVLLRYFSLIAIILLIVFWKYRWSLVSKIVFIVGYGTFMGTVLASVSYNLHVSTVLRVAILLVFAVVALVLPIIFLLKHMLIKPFYDMKGEIEVLSKKDLTEGQRVHKNDEFGEIATSLEVLKENLRDVITSIKKASADNAKIAENLSSSSQEVTASTEQVSSTLHSIYEETRKLIEITEKDSESLSKLTAQTEESVQKLNISRDKLNNTKVKTEEGSKYAKDAITKIGTITESSNKTVKVITELEQKSTSIPKIVDSINEISEQTNLLALNAAIEAARAGEAGKGFAVVSEEIRKLAEETQNSTKQISSLIEEIVASTKDAVNSVQNTSEEVDSGSTVIKGALSSLEEIKSYVDEVMGTFNTLEDEVQAQGEQQSKVFENQKKVQEFVSSVSQSVNDITAASSETSTAMTSVSEESQKLAGTAESLHEAVNQFKTRLKKN
ncbi:MAG: methyl-accepting chemotaxis protein [Nanobdellota archaeon]